MFIRTHQSSIISETKEASLINTYAYYVYIFENIYRCISSYEQDKCDVILTLSTHINKSGV